MSNRKPIMHADDDVLTNVVWLAAPMHRSAAGGQEIITTCKHKNCIQTFQSLKRSRYSWPMRKYRRIVRIQSKKQHYAERRLNLVWQFVATLQRTGCTITGTSFHPMDIDSNILGTQSITNHSEGKRSQLSVFSIGEHWTVTWASIDALAYCTARS